MGEMLQMICMKGAVTVVSLVIGFNGGVFAPSLFMGSLIGATCAAVAGELSLVTAPVAVFAMTGMGSFVATVFGAPIFAVIIVLEMTASFPATTMVLVGVSSSYLLSHQLFAKSFFDFQQTRDAASAGGASPARQFVNPTMGVYSPVGSPPVHENGDDPEGGSNPERGGVAMVGFGNAGQ